MAASVVVPVFGNLEQACRTIGALLEQKLDGGGEFEVVVVDDGSPDETPDALEAEFGSGIRLLRNAANLGRAEARNIGVRHCRGPHVVLLDSDCVPSHDRFLTNHLSALERGAIATCGSVAGRGGDFWDRYQRAASARREALLARGVSAAGTTANMGLRRSAFLRIGGFDTAYRRYGFEDRDLLLRLAALGDVVWVRDAAVAHCDRLSAATVCAKMREAGRFNSALFSSAHADAYRALGYARLDARLAWWPRLAGPIAPALAPALAAATDFVASIPHAPFPMTSALMKFAGALSFVAGTWEAAKKRPASTRG